MTLVAFAVGGIRTKMHGSCNRDDSTSEISELNDALLNTGLVDVDSSLNATAIEFDWNPLEDSHLEGSLHIFVISYDLLIIVE